jgi:hypothetical protein
VRRVFVAELRRHLRMAPGSMLMASVVFPFLTVISLYYLPTVDLKGKVHFQTAAWSQEGGTQPVPPAVSQLIDALQLQPWYRLEPSPDARLAFEQKKTDLALLVETGAAVSGPLPVKFTVLRRNDFFSDLFMDRLEEVRAEELRKGLARVPDVLVPRDAPKESRARKVRAGIVQIAPFMLIGFGWFFMTVGVVEGFVAERERRTLEHLLAASVERISLAWGKILFILFQSAGPQLSAALALIVLGFSPWVLSLSLLILLTLLPLCILSFWLYRDADNSLAAGWRNGLLFMLGFPALILSDDVVGTLSPLYHLGKVMQGTPPLEFYTVAFASMGGLALLMSLLLPRLVRGWIP